ncbi:MAG: hypothetical protein ACJAT0_002561 [Nonlabens sp.]|jgi:hypothetical protein|uniref:hypothetical protein n=1 Tax=Nonlabens sp. TaxID=1888209 RepID=UPI0039E2A2B0
MFDFNKINVKTRSIYGFLFSLANMLLVLFADFIFDWSDLGWDYYLFYFVIMAIFAFFFAGMTLKENF